MKKNYSKIITKYLFTFTLLISQLIGSGRALAYIGSGQNYTFYIPGLSNCSTTTTSQVVGGNKLFYIGDSLTYHMVKGSSKPENYETASGFLLEKSKAAGYDVDTTIPAVGGTDSTSVAPRIIGPSVEAQGGVNVANSIKHIAEHTQDYANANIIVIGLGTNLEQLDFRTEINELISTIRSNNPTAAIYWVDTYFTGGRSKTYQDVNAVIESAASENNFTVIHYSTAAIADPGIAPTAGGDGVHVDNGPARQKKADWLISQLPKPGEFSGNISAAPSGAYDPTSLNYPPFPDEAAMAKSIEDYIRNSVSDSPWFGIPNLGSWLLAETKARNVNPMIVMVSGKQENNFGTAGNNPRANNNYFGMKGDGGYIHFDSPIEGMTAFLDQLKRNIVDKSHANYVDVTTMYEYFSVHQTGGIHYPGDGLNLGDPQMPDVRVSWDTQYNPGTYWKTAASVISAITGINVSPDVPPRGSGAYYSGFGNCAGSNASTGDASKYIPDCGANNGNAAIACTAINQLSGIEYSLPQRALPTEPNPKFLDCSALVGMAIYRTFGLDLNGLCSVGYLSNSNFERIEDMHTIQPGDLIGKGSACTGAGGDGHIAIVVSYDPTTQKLITVETSSTRYLSGVRGVPGSYNVGLEIDGKGSYQWAVRYVGQKTLQPGAL